MITGIDLIQEQIKVAQGQKLSFTQDDIKFKVRGVPFQGVFVHVCTQL
jgi:acetyl/propionyl-CoA carboxylase alpha subunit